MSVTAVSFVDISLTFVLKPLTSKYLQKFAYTYPSFFVRIYIISKKKILLLHQILMKLQWFRYTL